MGLITIEQHEDGSIDVTGISPEGVQIAYLIEEAFKQGDSIEEIAARIGKKPVDIRVLYTIARQFGYIE